jgi:hypothetical protein
LKRTLCSLAKRVSIIPINHCETFDQWMSIRYDTIKESDDNEGNPRCIIVPSAQWFKFPPNFGYFAAIRTLCGDEHFIAEYEDVYCQEKGHMQTISSKLKKTDLQFSFDSTVCKVSCKLVVSNLPIEMSLLTQVCAVTFPAIHEVIVICIDVSAGSNVGCIRKRNPARISASSSC